MNEERKQPHGESAKEHVKIDAEKIKKAVQDMRGKIFEVIANVVPKGVYDHVSAAKKEILLAVKSVIDDEIKRTDENMSAVDKARHKGEPQG